LTVIGQALVSIGVASVLFVITAGVLAVAAVRGVRRRFRSARERLWGFAIPRMHHGGAPSGWSSVAAATLASPGWWAVQGRRHRMWRAVYSAEHAVGVARRSDAALGDLPALTSQLRAAAGGVDSVLCAGALRGLLREEDRAQCDRIEAAAADIHGAAVSSLRSASHADLDPFVSAVRIEVAALAAGVRAARS
jgi:hypothetical protein